MTNTALALPISELCVPVDLAELAQWVLWRYEARNSKQTKVPCQASGKPADCIWTNFETTLSTWSRKRQRYAGLGFVFSKEDALAGIDLDDSVVEQGGVKVWVRGIVVRFGDTYTEISPSGQGLKIRAQGVPPANLPGVHVGDGAIELYDHARYFAVTGRAYRGAPLHVEHHGSDLLMLYERLTPGKPGPQEHVSRIVLSSSETGNTVNATSAWLLEVRDARTQRVLQIGRSAPVGRSRFALLRRKGSRSTSAFFPSR